MIRFSSLFELLLAASCHWRNNKQTYFRLCVGTGYGSTSSVILESNSEK